MGTTSAAYGTFLFPQVPQFSQGAAVGTPWGTMLAPATRVAAYVRSGGPADGDDELVRSMLVTSLKDALRHVRSGRGDTIVVLPGHSENVDDGTFMDNLVAGTRIIGAGRGSSMPEIRWAAQAAQWAIAVDNVVLQGLRLRMEGANGVTKAMVVTGSDFLMQGCDIEVASGASNKAAIAIEVGSAAHRATIRGNRLRGTETHNVTDCIKVVGATPPSDLVVAGNMAVLSATAGNGIVNVTVASKRVVITGNLFYNTHTSSTACIAVGNVAADGVIAHNACATVNDGTAANQGVVIGAAATVRCFENYSSDEAGKSGVLAPAAVAT